MRTIPLLTLLLLGTLFAGCTGPPPGSTIGEEHEAAPGVQHAPPGTVAPAFTLTTIDGETLSPEMLEGKVVLLEFMGLGCTGCARNLPAHQATWDRYGDDDRFVFLAVNAWHAWCGDEGCGGVGESEEDMRAYREEHDLRWTFALASTQMTKAYDIHGTPTHFFIDHRGEIHGTGNILGALAIAAELDHLLGQVEGPDAEG